MSEWRLEHGGCLDVLRSLEADSVDAVVTDPPYGLGFMGKEWDAFSPTSVAARTAQKARKGTVAPAGHGALNSHGFVEYDFSRRGLSAFQSWCEGWAGELLRVMKPGAYLLAFGGTRTYHRMACAIEDAGFVIKDCLAWLYGSGFPKSRNLGDGIGTALKPAHEPIVLAQKPLDGTYAANVVRHGVAGLNIDACRIAHRDEDDLQQSEAKNRHSHYANPGSNRDSYSGDFPPRIDYDGSLGRWPANVVLDEEAGVLLDAQSGVSKSSGGVNGGKLGARIYGKFSNDVIGANAGGLGDSGGASRFFYCAKASRAERNAGLEGLPERPLLWSAGEQNPGSFQSEGTHKAARNHHPPVKPVALMRWLVRLVTPPGGVVLDPFVGSGTTGVACVEEGRAFVGVEREAEYIEIARRRIEHAEKAVRLMTVQMRMAL